MYQDVVGQSWVPDMVTEVRQWMSQLERDMTGSADEATFHVSEAFAGLNRQVSSQLATMITSSKLALKDWANFALDIANTVLANLISAGISAGMSGFFAPGAARPATGPGGLAVGGGATSVLHAGGIVGAPGAPRRLVSPLAFLGAERMHWGGMVGLRPGEVPIIAQRGETVLPRGAAAAGAPHVNVIINNNAGVAIEQRERQRPGGGVDIMLELEASVSRQIARGSHDRALRALFGLDPVAARR
jgi:hypothetical protein